MLLHLIRRVVRRPSLALACSLAAATAVHPGLARAHLGQTSVFAAVSLTGKLNLNTANQAQLELLPGVGPATAKRLLAYRDKHRFGAPSHIRRVKGIGKKTYQKLKPFLVVDGETTLAPAK